MPDSDTTTPPAAVKPFAAWLQEHRSGGLHQELSEALAEVARAVGEHEKVGTLTVTIKLEPNGPGTVIVTDDLKTKVPEPARPASLFFTDAGGNLSRRNPRQPELPLREVPAVPTDAEEATAS